MAMEIFRLMGTVAISKDQALKDIKAIQTQAEKTSTAMGKSFTKFSGYVEQHSAQIKKAGKMMTIFGGIATAIFTVAVKGAADFETQLANVSTMLDESAMRILPEYRRGLQSLSVEFGESTQTLSKGLYDILSASIPPAEALGVLEVSARAAAAGITDTGVAADAITTILNSYGFSADQAGMVSDKLFAIVKEGKTTFAELAPSIGKVAATASMAGLSFDDLGACIATMTRAGIRTEETMTAINGVLIAFLKPTDEAIAAAGKFGLELNTTTLQTEGLTGVMELLKDATAEQLAAIFPNIRGLKGMAAALGDAEGYARSYALMLESAGLTQEAFAKQSDTLNFKLDQLKAMFNVIRVTIGDALIPVVEDLTEKVMGALVKVKEWTEANKPLTETLVKWGGGISGVALVLGPLVMLLPGFVKNLGIITGWLEPLSIGFTGLATSIGLSAPALALAIIGFTKLGLEIGKAWKEVREQPSWKEIGEAAEGAAKSQATALEKLQKAYNLTNEELQYWIDNQRMCPRVVNEARREMQMMEADTRAMTEAMKDYVEISEKSIDVTEDVTKSFEDRDSVIAKSIITGEELSEQQEEYMKLRQRMTDIDRTATQQKIDDLDRECIALLANMDTNLMTMGQID
ncbi:MAG: phage tail tape measure protein, partial [Clostridia bacterium]|nr:phage tail tape measure protein [Clostridia bacterium]